MHLQSLSSIPGPLLPALPLEVSRALPTLGCFAGGREKHHKGLGGTDWWWLSFALDGCVDSVSLCWKLSGKTVIACRVESSRGFRAGSRGLFHATDYCSPDTFAGEPPASDCIDTCVRATITTPPVCASEPRRQFFCGDLQDTRASKARATLQEATAGGGVPVVEDNIQPTPGGAKRRLGCLSTCGLFSYSACRLHTKYIFVCCWRSGTRT